MGATVGRRQPRAAENIGMRLWHILRSRLRSMLFRDRRESDLSEELQLHLDREIERLQASGLSREEARLRARRLFGGVEQLKEECRDARGTGSWDALVRDTRQGLRRLVRDWRFTTAAVLILGLAIGANTAIFSVVNAVLFRKQAFADPDRLVNIYQNDRTGRPLVVTSYAAYKEIAEYPGIFAGTMAGSIPNPGRYLYEGAVRDAVVEFATATYLDVLGLRPSLGRWFDQSEEQPGAPLVAVVGYQAWTRLFRADPSLVGRVIKIEGRPVTIIGIGPANHRGTLDVGLGTDFWLPIPAVPSIFQNFAPRDAPTIFVPLFVKARLRDGVTVPQAKAAMDVLGRRLAAENPEAFRTEGEFSLGPGMTVVTSTDVRIHPQADKPFMAIASLVLVVVGLVLAIACSNLATLLLVRGATRAKEVSVRLAMGATRRQLVRHLLTESVLLSLAGGIAGCIVASWAMRALQQIDLPFRLDFTVDYRVLAFAIAVSLVTGVVFGLAPALKSTRVDLLQTLRDEGLQPIDHRRLTLKNALIVFQVAISVLLLGGTSIFLQMTAAARALRIGYAVDGVSMLETDLRFASYSDADARRVYDDLLRRIQAVPGVQAAALLRGLPMGPNSVQIVVDGASDQNGCGSCRVRRGTRLLRHAAHPAAVWPRVRRTGPRRHAACCGDHRSNGAAVLGAVDAVGRRFRLQSDPNSWTEVIGVVRDTGTGDFEDDILDPIGPPFYNSYTQAGALPTTVIGADVG